MQIQVGNHFSLSIEQALFLENRLNEVRYNDIPTGGLFADLLYMSYFFSSYQTSLKQRAREYLQYQYLKYIPRTTEAAKPSISLKNRYLLCYSLNTERLTAFYPPLIALFSKVEIAFASKPNEQNKDWSEYPFFSYIGLTKDQYQRWKDKHREFERDFHLTWNSINKTLYLPKEIKNTLLIVGIIQTQRLQYFFDYFEHERPRCLVTDHDRKDFNAALVLAANAKKIDTYTLVHGSTLPIDFYVPLLANAVLCWGKSQQQQFIEAGVPPSRIHVVGNQKMSDNFDFDISLTRKQLSGSDLRHNILIITNPIAYDQKLRFVSDIINGLTTDKYKIIIRIHPAEKKHDYKGILGKFPDVLLINSEDFKLNEALACADLIIAHNSITILEGMVKKIPVVIYNPPYITFPVGIGAEVHQHAGVPMVSKAGDIEITCSQFLSGLVQQDNQEYIQGIYYSMGTTAAHNIMKVIKKKKKR